MSKDNIGCTIAAVIMLSVIGMGLYLVNLQDREDEEREKEAKEIEEKSTGWDEFVIIDRNRCAHVGRCLEFIVNDSLSSAIKYIDTLSVTEKDYDYVCLECVNGKKYKHLKRMALRNENDKTMPGVKERFD